MSNLRITPVTAVYFHVKKFTMPAEVVATCPTCHQDVTLQYDYLSYPTTDEPFEVEFEHEYYPLDGEGCFHSWKETVRLTVTLSEVKPAQAPTGDVGDET